MDAIALEDLQVDCIIGVLEREQRAPQRIVVDLRLRLDLEAAGEDGDLERSVDYAAVAEQVRMLAEHGRFRLLESLGLAVCRLLLAPPAPGEGRAQVAQVEVALRKPEILAGICVPGVRMSRDAAWCQLAVHETDGARAERLVDLPQGGAWRVSLPANTTWDPGDRALYVVVGSVDAGRTHGPGDRVARGVVVRTMEPTTVLAVGKA